MWRQGFWKNRHTSEGTFSMTRRRTRTWTELSFAVLGCLILSGCGYFTSTADRLARATQALDEGRVRAAEVDARTVVQKDPHNVAGRLLLARISLKYEHDADALRELQQAASAGATDEQVRPLRDEALLLARKFDDILAEQANGPDQKVARAQALMALDRRDEAAELIRAVLAQKPRHSEARQLNIRLMDASGQHAEAKTLLAAMLAEEPDNAKLALLKSRFAFGEGDTVGAIAALEKADRGAVRQLSIPEQTRLIAALTEQLIAARQLDKASAALTRLKARAPGAMGTELLSARLQLAQGNVNGAIAILEKSLAKKPEQPPAQLLLASILLDQGSIEQARAHLNALLGEQPENLAARKLMARLLTGQGDTRGAEQVLADAPQGAQADASADLMRSAILSAGGQPAEALAALERAANANPKNIAMQLELARAYVAGGRHADAKRTLQAVAPQATGWDSKRVQVMQRVAGQPPDKARGALVALASEHPKDAELRTVVGQSLAQLRDVDGAARQFREALALVPQLSEAHLGLAGVALVENDLDGAAEELQKVTAEHPELEGPYLALAGIASRQGKQRDARKWLEQGIRAVPAAVMARVSLADLSFQEGQTAAADALLDRAVSVAGDKGAALLRVGEVQLRAGQPENAVKSFESAYAQRPRPDAVARLFAARRAAKQAQPDKVLRDWLQKHPDDVPIRGLLADYLLAQGDHRAAAAEYEKLAEKAPSPVYLNNLAWLYQTLGDSRAEAVAKRAYDAVPNHPTIADTYGWILMEKGRVAEALPLLTKAAAAAPRNAEIKKHLERAHELAAKR
jgi:putative PEP-CTERM system TPR-repeat lipoprotein